MPAFHSGAEARLVMSSKRCRIHLCSRHRAMTGSWHFTLPFRHADKIPENPEDLDLNPKRHFFV